jgi:hypothetical protein
MATPKLAHPSVVDRLKKKPDAYLKQIALPNGASKVSLKPAKTIRLIAGDQKLMPDGIYAFRRNGRLTCVAIQAEDTTGKNVSSLLGKALFSQLCNNQYSLIRVDEVHSTNAVKASRIDRLVVVFVYSASNGKVGNCVNGIVQCLSPVNELASNVFAIPVDLADDQCAIDALQSIVSGLSDI